MKRIPEPELMDEAEQAAAYAQADFSAPHDFFVEQFSRCAPASEAATLVLDVGCGPADITVRMARRFPAFQFHAVDGAAAMLDEGKKRLQREGLQDRIRLLQGRIPGFVPPAQAYPVIISNSLLHHLHQPEVLWQFISQVAADDGFLFLMDLCRPQTGAEAEDFVSTYSGSEPEILKRDFLHSLYAAFTVAEVEAQLAAAGLAGLQVRQVTDRHLQVQGFISSAQ